MPRDDDLDKEFSELEEEIEAKVDSLFIEGELEEEAVPSAEEDPWKELKEYFLTLEWEIDLEVLDKISDEVKKLQARYSDHPLSVVLGWMDQMTQRIRAKGTDVDQESMKVFHQLKDGLLQLADDPLQDPGPIVDPLREQVLQFLEEEEEEAPTITIEAAEGEEDQLFAELDRAVDEALRMDEVEPAVEEEAPPEAPLPAEEEPAMLQKTVIEEGVDQLAEATETVVAGAEEMTWAQETQVEPPELDHLQEEAPEVGVEEEEVVEVEEAPPAVAVEEEVAEISDLEQIRVTLTDAVRELQSTLEDFRDAEDPFGLAAFHEGVRERLRQFSESTLGVMGSLQEGIRALEGVDLAPALPEQEPAAEPEIEHEEVLFVSVSNRVFGIPLACVRGIFRVPGEAAARLIDEQEVSLKGKTVPLVPLWRKLGLARALYTFPKEEKRIVLVSSAKEETGLLVDQILAQQDAALNPVEDAQRALFKGRATVEKAAFVVDIEAL